MKFTSLARSEETRRLSVMTMSRLPKEITKILSIALCFWKQVVDSIGKLLNYDQWPAFRWCDGCVLHAWNFHNFLHLIPKLLSIKRLWLNHNSARITYHIKQKKLNRLQSASARFSMHFPYYITSKIMDRDLKKYHCSRIYQKRWCLHVREETFIGKKKHTTYLQPLSPWTTQRPRTRSRDIEREREHPRPRR